MTITAAQREARKNGIFSSDVPRIMMGDSVRLTLEKLGEVEPDNLDDVPAVQLGNVLEGPVLTAWETLSGQSLARSLDTLHHPEYAWLGAHLDGFAMVNSVPCVVEAKTVNHFARHLWGDPGSDEVPDRVLWQVQTQMAVTGTRLAEVPVCFINEAALLQYLTRGTLPIDIYLIERSDELVNFIINESQKVWQCVQAKSLPEPVMVGDARLIWRKGDGTIAEADGDIAELHAKHAATKEQIKALEKEKAVQEELIQTFMQGASELRYRGATLATWKNDKDGTKFNADRFAKMHPDIYSEFLEPKTGARKFLAKAITAAIPQEKAA